MGSASEPRPRSHFNTLSRLAKHNFKSPAARKSVEILYHKKSTNRVVRRKVDPLTVVDNHMVAYDNKRKAVRSFKIDRIKSMTKTAFWNGFFKEASRAHELAGLGLLAAPVASKMVGHEWNEKAEGAAELGGLGLLAYPYAKGVAKDMSKGIPWRRALSHA